jgi:N-acetylglutamate synthase-like GNAT family acetyltransferase
MDSVRLTIRKAHPADAPAIHNILAVSFSEYHTLLGIRPKALTESIEDIVKEIKNKTVLVAVVNNMLLCGTLRYEFAGDVCYISRFGVLPNWQAAGAGGELLAFVEQACSEAGTKAMCLHTATKLFKQTRYYYGQGFFIHSTTHDRGYVRGLFVKELSSDPYDLSGVINL